VEDAILVDGLGKRFRRSNPARPHTLQEAFVRGLGGIGRQGEFWALQDLTFRVAPGRTMGVIGRNGAGKSTLLRLLGGVAPPDAGTLRVHGRVGALLDLGAGFHPDLTGRENLLVGGVIGGLTRREVVARFDSMVSFAELEASIDYPLRTYSTGMQMRLAFSVAVHMQPEVLLVDEVLAVGDVAFQQKCLERIRLFRAEGCTIVIVSHDAAMVQTFCDEALWLSDGRIAALGPAGEVVARYLAPAETEWQAPSQASD
jgi:lipopolysaccharide transport system ATP-binding protein